MTENKFPSHYSVAKTTEDYSFVIRIQAKDEKILYEVMDMIMKGFK